MLPTNWVLNSLACTVNGSSTGSTSGNSRLNFQIQQGQTTGCTFTNGLTASDSVLIPLQCEYLALEGLTQLIGAIRLVQDNLNPGLRIEGVLLTMYDSRLNLSQQVAEEARKFFAERVYRTVIPRNVRLSEAPSFGKPIVLYDPHSTGAESYRDLAREVLDHA